MKTTFKMSLVALALVAGASQAATIVPANAGKVYGHEGLTTTTGSNVNIVLGAAGTGTNALSFPVPGSGSGDELAENDLIRITFSVPFTAGVDAPTHVDLTTGAGGNTFATGGTTLRVANSGSNFVVYRVSGAGSKIVPADVIQLNTAKFPTRDIAAAGGLKATISLETATGTVKHSVKDAVLAEVKKVRTFTLTQKLSGKIDVSQGRTAFAASPAATSLVTTNPAATTVDAFGVTYTSIKGAVAGDFSWVKDTVSTNTALDAATGLFTIGNCGVAPTKVTASQVEFSCAGDKAVGLVIDLAKNTDAKPDEKVASVLKASNFALTATAEFTNPAGLASNEIKVFDSADAGSWSLNGSNVLVPYMVYGTVGGKAYNQVIQLTNNSKVEGAIYVDITDGEGKAIASNQKLTIAAKPNSVTNIGSEIKALVAAAKYEGKVSIRVVAEIPSDSTEVYAAYQDVATSERAIVVGLSTK